LPLNALCQNQVDVETELFGIGSTNLVTPKTEEVTPIMTDLMTVHFAKRLPVILPEPLVIYKNERPFTVYH
jgi:hypothetical protein